MESSPRRRRRPLGVESLERRELLNGDVASPDRPELIQGDLIFARFSQPSVPRKAREILDAAAAVKIETLPEGPTVYRVGPGVETDRLIRRLGSVRGVVYAEPNTTVRQDAFPGVPDDPRFTQLWGLSNASGVDIEAIPAWSITTGDPSTIVAIIDSGIDSDHPDFVSRVWVNPGEIPGNGVDDDSNGKIDDVHGWNFIDDSGNVRDDNGHGTHLAGVIAATPNDQFGVAGVNWRARVMPLKFLDVQGDGSLDDAVRAVYYAVQNGAKVINASWGGGLYSRPLFDAIRYAGERDVVFVTAAGNEGANNDRVSSYPGNYALSNILSVAAVDRSGKLAGFSNRGARTVDVAAPGVGIVSTAPRGGFATYSGTSMAAPYVSGIASLVMGRFPGMTASQVVARVKATAKPLASLSGKVETGLANAYHALTGAPFPKLKKVVTKGRTARAK